MNNNRVEIPRCLLKLYDGKTVTSLMYLVEEFVLLLSILDNLCFILSKNFWKKKEFVSLCLLILYLNADSFRN